MSGAQRSRKWRVRRSGRGVARIERLLLTLLMLLLLRLHFAEEGDIVEEEFGSRSRHGRVTSINDPDSLCNQWQMTCFNQQFNEDKCKVFYIRLVLQNVIV